MNGKIQFNKQAERDLVEIYQRYEREAGSRTAERFLNASRKTFGWLRATPGMGSRLETFLPEFPDIRYLPLASRFQKYLVFYQLLGDQVEVLRILHGAQDLHSILGANFNGADDD